MSTPAKEPQDVKASLPDHLTYQAKLERAGSLAFAGPMSDESGEHMRGIGMNLTDDTGSRETSATRAAYLSLREMILVGELPAGRKLKIERLRKLLNVGASPVREALSPLKSDMLVERIDQRGFRAAPASIANLEEILMLRSTLEDMALRRPIARATPDWEERVGTETFEEAQKSFRLALLSNAETPMLERYCSQLYDLNIRYRYLAAGGARYQSRGIAAEHEQICNAAVRGKNDTGDIQGLCLALLSTEGVISGQTLAATVFDRHRSLSAEDKRAFFVFLNDELDIDALAKPALALPTATLSAIPKETSS